MQPDVLVVSSVCNEAQHVARMVRDVAAQTCPPARWLVVDDGSTEGTLDLLRVLEREVAFLHVHPREPDNRDAPDRLAVAAAPRAFNAGLRCATNKRNFTHIAKLDGDIELPPDYLERLLARFAADPSLGIAGGDLAESRGGKLQRVRTPRSHVPGALKCYTSACFEAGGVQECQGWTHQVPDPEFRRFARRELRRACSAPSRRRAASGTPSSPSRGARSPR